MDDDHYVYDERTYTLVGDYTGKTYRPGDRVSTVVAGADMASRNVDLILAD
jgi:ribonuclease R